ncbi:anti-sigma regulatory factor (Ser/Thr protein kinase) [Natranaerovirga pectinivora]|uniref:Anti-sigma regulatory factor (Ser/Thr protein kinase) n=1 Tax=Natranaerovirga pectinivora TaxID=682400 RepID=A0A4R3MLJ9_9FIRM|nr:anti-sigma regulatory factor [Natranaerovirga pectinivora]TCT14984.1 anti-sigma regulatory factor (Ser/Thr protein kinase) [Natranaerovirga pectinivora]
MTFHYDVLGDEFTHAGVASSKVKKILKQLGVPAEIVRKVAIAMYEAEINMVIHANGGVIDGDINEDRIYIVLKDEGPGIEDIKLAMKAGYSTATARAREMGFGAGMGLPNMKRHSDDLKITSEVGKGTVVEIIVFLS